jgi:ligand-binding sensor domain-containing protein/signal transduction histidine kinase
MSQYIHDRWGTEQGFPRGPVYAIAQTTDGYLWIGTEAGLVRFDGVNFRLVRDDSSNFTITSVLGLIADKEGNLWVRLQGQTLLRYHDGVFDRPVARLDMPPANITAMALENRGAPLISMMERGALAWRKNRFEMLASAEALPRSPVLALAQTSNGEVWVGTRDAGLFRLSGGQTTAVTKGLPDSKINCLLPDGQSDLWVGTDDGVVRWNGRKLTAAGIPQSLNHLQALTLTKDRDGNIWVGTDSRGLLRFNIQGVASLNAPGAAVTAVYEDREGNLWIGSAGGLERLRDSAFITYSSQEGVPSDGTSPVYVDKENRAWFSPVSGGLWWMKDGQRGRVAIGGLNHDVVYSIAGRSGDLWLGRRHGGLTRVRLANGSFHAETWTRADGLTENSVYSVYQANDGTVWAGTLSGGVSRFAGGKFTTYTRAAGLASNTVTSILEGDGGSMWFATPNGLSTLVEGKWHVFTVRDGLPADNVNSLLRDAAGLLWVGTSAGLAVRTSSGFHLPAKLPSVLREQILGMASDQYGWLWVATANHVLRVRREQLLRGTLADGDLREYGIADGLRGVEGVKRQRSVIADPLGRIWFSMNRGVSVVDPARLTSTSAPALVAIQAISADGNPITLRGTVRIPPSPRRLTFLYAGLSLSVPDRVRFRYSLEGYDRQWSEPTALREAVYTNLPPRSYRFRVRASNPDGVWSPKEAAIAFEVDPLFWQSWWFRISALLACILTIVALYRFRLRQLARQLNMRFDERLAERTRIAQELHDTLLQGFLSASMQLHVAVDSMPTESPAKASLSRIIQMMSRVIDEGRNAVRGLRSSPGGTRDLALAFSLIRQELAIPGETEFRVIVEGRPRPLHPMIRDEVYRIGREALVNAFRHSAAESIEVELEFALRRLRILVRDNGCGINAEVLQGGREGHWGLAGMRERAESIGARLQLWSGPLKGTEVELAVPARVAYDFRWSRRLLRSFARLNRLTNRVAGRSVRKEKNK